MKLSFKKPKKVEFRKYWNLLLAMSRATILTCLAAVVLLILMLYRLESLTPGLSASEIQVLESANSINVIAENMVNAPYKLAVLLATSVFDSAFGLRLTGAIIGIASVVLFYLFARNLFTGLVTVAATTMYATSSLLLTTSRQATPNIMLLGLLAVIGVGFYLRFGKKQDLAWVLTAAVIGLALYVPGMAIFIVAAAIWQFRHVRKSFERLQTQTIATASIVLGILITPLIVSLIRDPDIWKLYLGFPQQFASMEIMFRYAGTAFLTLFFRSPIEPSWWLGRQPVLDVFALFMFGYGVYNLLKQFRLDRLWTIGGVFLVAFLWIGATTNRLAIIVLLPFVYIVVGIGLQQFTNKWTGVFPKNPIARWTGGLILFVAIAVSVNFQTHRYFTAWPNSDDTEAAYSLQYPR